MKKILTIASILLISNFTFAGPSGPSVSNAKVIELTAHRIDRLVALGKIDASFLKNLEKIEVSIVQDQAPTYFKVRVTQTLPAQGAPLQVDIAYDEDGKPLAFAVIPGGVAGPEVGWSDKDADSLIENALHYILDNTGDAKVSVFDKTSISIKLTQEVMKGETVARGQVLSATTAEKLNIYLKLDGTFISAEIVP